MGDDKMNDRNRHYLDYLDDDELGIEGVEDGDDTEFGDRLIASFTQAVAGEMHVTRFEAPSIDVRALREDLGLSQRAFALRYGFSLSAVRHWEQGNREPEAAARLLLAMIRDQREAVERQIERLGHELEPTG